MSTWPKNKDVYGNVLEWLAKNDFEVVSPTEIRSDFFKNRREKLGLSALMLDLKKTSTQELSEESPSTNKPMAGLSNRNTSPETTNSGRAGLRLFDSPLFQKRNKKGISSMTLKSSQSSESENLSFSGYVITLETN